MLIEDLIDKFLKKINIIFNSKRINFIYNAMPLNKNLSAIKASLTNGSTIRVVFTMRSLERYEFLDMNTNYMQS